MSATDRDIYALAALFRDLVAAREAVATDAIVLAYATLYDVLRDDLDRLLDDVAALREAGRPVTMGTVARMERLQSLVEQVEAEVTRIAGSAAPLITDGQRELVLMADQHARQLMLAGLGPPPGIVINFNALPTNAIETMVGFLRPGTPLSEALDRLPGMAADDVREALVRGIGTGQHPRVVARQFRQAIGGNVASAERLARTAQLNAYREANRAVYQQNPTIVREWLWHAELGSDRTCMSCVAMHGRTFPLDVPLVDHWNGRCAAIPVTPSWSEIMGGPVEGLPDQPQRETGLEWFERQSPAMQRRMLGRAKYHAYRAGELDLSSLSKVVDDPIWGPMRVEASLKDILGAERARHWYGQGAEIELTAGAAP